MSLVKGEYILDRINLRRVQKDCLMSFAVNQYSVPVEYVGKDVAAVDLDSTLAVHYNGKQISSPQAILPEPEHGRQSGTLPAPHREAAV